MKRALLAMALLLIPTLALAQAETTGRVTGTILDEDRNPVVGAEITLESPALQGQRKSSSDANGRYLASLLPPGVYTMTVNAPGKTPLQYTFRVGIGQTVPIDAVLKSGSDLVEDVVVFSPASKLETTATGENFSYEERINQLPVVNRQLENVAQLAPNVSFGPNAGSLVISGAPAFDTVVLLDGAEISDPYFGSSPVLYFEDALEEVQVLTSGISAKYGRFTGGVVNATTKSGGNTFDGQVRVDFTKETWNSQSPFGEAQSDKLNKTYQGLISGPIVKDHLWFFGGYRTIPTLSRQFETRTTGEFWNRVDEQDRYQIKLTGAITPNHVLDASYLNYENTISGYAGLPAGDLLATTGVRTDPREIYTFEYQGVLTDRMFLNFQGTKKDVSIVAGATDTSVSPFIDLTRFRVYHNHWWDENDPDTRNNETGSLSATNVLASGWGDHTLEYGVQYVNSITGGENRQSASGKNLLFLGNPSGFPIPVTESTSNPGGLGFNLATGRALRWVALPGVGDQELTSTALYVQEAWEYGKWRVDLGLRYEQWDSKAQLPTLNVDFKELVPRVGLTYNITPEWQLQGSWGKYTARINDNIAGSVSGVGAAPYIQSIYIGDPVQDQTYQQIEDIIQDDAQWFVTNATDPTQPTQFLADNLKAPYSTDLTVGVKRALPRNTGIVTFNYTRREYKQLLDDFVGGLGFVDFEDPSTGEVTQFDRLVWDNADLARRDYEALSVTLDYRPSARWDIGGNYVFSKTRGNYEGEATNQPASGSVIGDYPDSIQQDAAIPYGYTDDDVRHRVRAYGNYRFDFGRGGNLILGGLFTYRSGSAWSRTGEVDANDSPDYLGDVGYGTYDYYFDGRGNNRFSGFWQLDTSIRYNFPIWRDLNIWAKADVQNITDEDNLISFTTSGVAATNDAGTLVWQADSDFGTASSRNNYQLPRTFNIALGISF